MTTTQECPNCGTQHDTRVYVSGQKLTCRCGIRFEVRRQDVGGVKPVGAGNSNITFAPHRAQPLNEHTRDTVVPGLGGEERGSRSPSYANGGALRDASAGSSGIDWSEEREPGSSRVGAAPGGIARAGASWVGGTSAAGVTSGSEARARLGAAVSAGGDAASVGPVARLDASSGVADMRDVEAAGDAARDSGVEVSFGDTDVPGLRVTGTAIDSSPGGVALPGVSVGGEAPVASGLAGGEASVRGGVSPGAPFGVAVPGVGAAGDALARVAASPNAAGGDAPGHGGASPGAPFGVPLPGVRAGEVPVQSASGGGDGPGNGLQGAPQSSNESGGVGPSGVALPSSTPGMDVPVDATVVRSTRPTGRGDADSDLDIHSVETFVAAARVTLPGFELKELLGRGGMGEVWLARQTSLGRTVAVKLLPPKLAKDPEFVARFEKEATALAALNHPNIVQIIDRGVAGEHYYFVMEFVEGRSLREAISTGSLTPQQGLKLMLQAARAIECAHDKDIIHRDLKPENILLDGRGNVKVADFGLAGIRQSEARLQLTATAVAMGTLNYMAPEQRRDAKSVDGRADLFSLGVVLYELLTGELPLGRFKLPSKRVPGLDPRVDHIIDRLLETDPEARYAKATELCEALELLVASTSAPNQTTRPTHQLEGRRKSTSQITRKLRTGWRRVRAGLSVVGGLAVLGLGARWVNGRMPEKPNPPNTYAEAFSTATLVEAATPDGEARFEVSFDDKGPEELNLHSGLWKVEGGQLRAWQGGQDAGGRRLVPRAYVATRYFAADHFDASVMMDVKPLGDEYRPDEPDSQHYGELSFRIRDLQVSAFAIPEVGMRLAWRYFAEDGQEIVGNSAQDTDGLVEDEMPLPDRGPYQVRLKLSRVKGGVLAEGFLGRQRFARKLLPGLENRVAKVAVGCRNLACTFDDLKVKGQLREQPLRRASAGQEQ
ncbi:protein kinase domain-containing protein [Myxococcus faecalis]|jgi:serine/threonine-protein kinase|uniref:serine/threonine-protein kinase n=1 Tax=Myxococcus faecalis TaxID=3115646 RepID=UPI0038CF4404